MKSTMSTWVLVADGSRATLLATDLRFARAEVLRQLDHPESRAKGMDLMADDRGRTAVGTKATGRRAGVAPSTPPKEVEVEKFSRELGEMLRLAHARHEYGALVLVAPPHFLGRLRGDLSRPVAACVRAELDKDYTQMNTRDLLAALRKQLADELPLRARVA